jgi:Bifunctional DNA primase/polymerase, N-terminal
MPRLSHAHAYTRRGWSVLPLWWPDGGACACGRSDCQSVAKHPIHHLVPHGLHDATADPDLIGRWWRSFPQANVGVRTGAESELMVLDLDGEIGREILGGLVAHYGRFDALWARTGSGGWHAYLAHPGVPVPNSARRVGEGLDVRGDGGYVVAPPSRHASGRRYRWIDPRCEQIALGGRELPSMPRWLLELVAPRQEDRPAPQPVRIPRDRGFAYAAAAIEHEAQAVTHAPRGQRNHRLNRAAFRLGQLVGAGLVDEVTVTEALVAAGLAAGRGERKIRSTIRSGLRAGMSQPRPVRLGVRDDVPNQHVSPPGW